MTSDDLLSRLRLRRATQARQPGAGLGRATGVAAALLLLLAAAPSPAQAVTALRQAGGSLDPAEPLVAALSLAAWLIAGWLLACIACAGGSHLPGVVGRALGSVARRTTPRAVRRGLEATLGLTIAVGALAGPASAAGPGAALDSGASSAVAAEAAPAVADQVPLDLDWGQPAAPLPPDPVAPAADPAVPTPPAEAAGTGGTVVRAGDTLWALAEQELRADGAAAPTAREVAQRWPAWWAANRDAIGSDPDLITPGVHLIAPPAPPG